MYFQIAMNYGCRDEILRGMTRMIEDVKNGTLTENAFDENGKLTEQCFESYLDTAGIPDPDLLIRTSGEQRLSNYLMWQLAYTEFYFTEVPWPDFHEEELRKAIEQYNNRDRRYGGVKDGSKKSMFKTRLLSGIVLVLVALLTICSGGTVLYMTVLCLSLIGAGELFRVMKVREDKLWICWKLPG